MNVIITRQIPETGIELLRQTCDVTVWPNELPPSREELKQLVRGADGIICLLSDKIDAEIMDAAGPQLKVISNYAVGVDNINLADASARQIRVGNTPGILTNATADMAFSLLLAAARSVSQGDRYVRDAKWKTWGPKLFLGYELTQKTLGIVGFGRIGKAFAKRALGWDMRVLFYSPSYPKEEVPELNACKVDLDTLLRESDFISLHCPLNDRSRGMINAEVFAKMKPNAILINTARGPVVDSKALYEALNTRQIAAAGLDVTDPEPIPLNDPLLELDNLVITPHTGSATYHARETMSVMVAENVLAGLRDEVLPFPVN